MLDWLAHRVSRALVVVDQSGELHYPGGNRARRWVQPDGTELSLVNRGDALDLYIGKKTIYNLTIDPKVAVSLAAWVISWWVFTMWIGLKSRLWLWSFRRLIGKSVRA